jgi:hypothetical protein
MQDWEREQADDMFRQQAMDYMAEQQWHMKNQEARQQMHDLYGDGGPYEDPGDNPLDTLIRVVFFLVVGGCAIYAFFATIFGG